MLAVQASEDFVPFIQKLEHSSWQGGYMAAIWRMIQSSVNYQLVRCLSNFQKLPTGSSLSTIMALIGSSYLQLVYSSGWSISG